MDKEQAIKLYESKFWEDLTDEQIAKFQLFNRCLCMPFNIFHKALNKTLGRLVYTHEFGLNIKGLKKELMGKQPAPTLEEIINLIPKEKRIIIDLNNKD